MNTLEESLAKIAELEKIVEKQEEIIKIIEENCNLQKEQNNLLKKHLEKLREENKNLKAILEEKIYGARISFRRPEIHHKQTKPGRPEGHEGSSRPVPDKVDEKIEKKLDSCPDCGHKLADIGFRKRIIEDIVPTKIKVTEVLIHEYYCKHCKEKKEAPVAEAFPNCRLGLVLYLFVVFLKMKMRQPYNQIKKLLKIVYGMDISEAELYRMNLRIAWEFKDKYVELIKKLKESPSVNIDETGWRINGENRWLWAFISQGSALYHIDEKRNQKVVKKFIGEEYDGVVTSDFLHAYGKGLPGKKQKCLVHLKRSLKETAERKEPNSVFHKFRKKLKRILVEAESYSETKYETVERVNAKAVLEDKIADLCNRNWRDNDCKRFVKRLQQHKTSLFTYLLYPGIKSDNNAAERGIRPNVIIRKISYGNRSEEGALTHSVNMSMIETCNLNNQNFLDWSRSYFEEKLLK